MAGPVSRLAVAVWWRAKRMAAAASARRCSLARLRDGPIRRVLVVCHGNIYRSAFVGQYLMQHLPESGERSFGWVPSGCWQTGTGAPHPVQPSVWSGSG